MAGWFTTTRDSLRGEPSAPVAVPFERACLCGEVLAGERDDSPQTIVCERCGRDWFVLPGDAYPVPRSRKPKKAKKKSPRGTGSPAKNGKAAADGPATAAASAKETQSDASRQTAVVDQKKVAIPIGPPWHERLRGRLQRGARPVRLIAGGILVLFVLTGIWLWYQARLDDAAAVLVDAVPAAEAAIAEGDLPTAAARMREAAGALDILGRDDATARRIGQRHRELVAITELASLTPYDLAMEAELSANDPSRWSNRFAASYAGQWIILDIPLGMPRPATGNKPAPSEEPNNTDAGKEDAAESQPPPPVEKVIPLELPLMAGDVPVWFELKADAIDGLADSSRAILALQYRSWRMMEDAAGNPVWVVRFQPETGFLWASPDLYQAAGFPLGEEGGRGDNLFLSSRKLLAKQAEMLGINTEKSAQSNDAPTMDIGQ